LTEQERMARIIPAARDVSPDTTSEDA
jgi:hypothetical protein